MKILHVINNLSIGGAQKLVYDIAILQKDDPQIDVACFVFNKTDSQIERNLQKKGINLIVAGKSLFSNFKKLIKQMKQVDLVHVHLFPSNYIVAIANIIAKRIIIFTEHSTHNRRRNYPILRPIERYIYKKFYAIACISDATSKKLIEWIDSKPISARISIIENGIDIAMFSKAISGDPMEVFGKSGIPIIMISRFTQSKDHPTLIRALPLIRNKEIFVVFVGDGERRKEIEDMVQELNVEDRVVFLGTCLNMPTLIKSAKLGVQSSNWEGFGLTAVEIMASGVPLIASDVNGLNEVVKDAAILFPKSNEYILAQEIEKLLSNRDLYYELQKRGLERAKDYSITLTVDKYRALYKKLIGDNN